MSNLNLPPLHEGQQKVFDSKAKIRVLACGARWGKDRLTIIDMIIKTHIMAVMEKERRKNLIPRVLAWYVAPTYNLLRQSWAEAMEYLSGVPDIKINHSEKRIFLPTGVEIEFKSADRPGSLLGRGLDYVAVTECARMKKESWYQGLVTRLASPGRGFGGKGGIAILNSTPEGRNWYYDLYMQAEKDDSGYMEAFHFTSLDNPYIIREEIERQRLVLPSSVFAQEYMAKFNAGSGNLFVGLVDCVSDNPDIIQKSERDDEQYIIGVDFGRSNDSTVISVVGISDEKIFLRYQEEMNNIPFSEQIIRLKKVIEKFPSAMVYPEKNSFGAPMVERLQEECTNTIIPWITTNESKRAIIENLQLIIEQQKILIPEEYKKCIQQLGSYQQENTTTGKITYNAPCGEHDDFVMSLAIACYNFSKSSSKKNFICKGL